MHTYDKHPIVKISASRDECAQGWAEIGEALHRLLLARPGLQTIAVELYPGVDEGLVSDRFSEILPGALAFFTRAAFRTPAVLKDSFAQTLTSDPVFNVMMPQVIDTYFEPNSLAALRTALSSREERVILLGPGASYVLPDADLLLSGNVSRWELQQRQRGHRIGNLGFDNLTALAAELYKNAYFLDWRVADDVRHRIFGRVDFFLDLNDEENPRLLSGESLRSAVRATVQRPFRVVPFFDPGPWGGQWMRRHFDLPAGPPNFAWGFDCVPEENSVLLGFGDRCFELPAIVLVHEEPELLLGKSVHCRFGAEFPIRFDLLDTVEGGNLSLQVHPAAAYIREQFGMPYTQDESYYILHAEPGASMYLGLCEGIDPEQMTEALVAAQQQTGIFAADDYIAKWPTATHDHFSIPAGTVHCSGSGNVVLEISATPYIFTFKLWDWGRNGLDGMPRPIHLEHGLANICWERTADWVADELIDQVEPVGSGAGWREERTGLHRTQFLETRRHWFTSVVDHDTKGNLRVLNLVQGNAAVLSSPDRAFAPMTLHFGETCIVPASVGRYSITPSEDADEELATVTAYLRS